MTEAATVRVLIADEHPIVRMGLASMVGASADLCLVGESTCPL